MEIIGHIKQRRGIRSPERRADHVWHTDDLTIKECKNLTQIDMKIALYIIFMHNTLAWLSFLDRESTCYISLKPTWSSKLIKHTVESLVQ